MLKIYVRKLNIVARKNTIDRPIIIGKTDSVQIYKTVSRNCEPWRSLRHRASLHLKVVYYLNEFSEVIYARVLMILVKVMMYMININKISEV